MTDVNSMVLTRKYTHTRSRALSYSSCNELPKFVLGVRISDYFTLPSLGASVRAAAIVNFFLKEFAIKVRLSRATLSDEAQFNLLSIIIAMLCP